MFKCPICEDKINEIEDLYEHLDEEHIDMIPKNFTPAQYFYFVKTGKDHGSCVICKKNTKWNPVTNKYARFCENPNCKETYIKEFRQRMIGKYGKISLLNEPEQQKKMLANRSISGKYKWSDDSAEITYTGTYELDFLRFLDLFLNFESSDIMAPSPHTYYYEYEGEKKFYIPDFFIASLNLEVEIKDGGDNPNNHHKIQDVDKVKEKLKDEVLMSQKQFSYVKITNKNYEPFFELLVELKKQYQSNKDIEKLDPIFIVKESFVTQTPSVIETTVELDIVTENAFILNNLNSVISLRLKMLQTVSSFEPLKQDLIELADKCETNDDISYLLKDISMTKTYLNSVIKNSPEMKTAASEFITWIDTDYKTLLNNKRKSFNTIVKKEKVEDIKKIYDAPMTFDQIKAHYGEETYKKLKLDKVHSWRAETGLELIHKEPSREELERIWANWKLMSFEKRNTSDKKSKELFGISNRQHYEKLSKEFDMLGQ